MEHDGEDDTYCKWCVRNNPERFDKGTGSLRKLRTSKDLPDYSIIKIGENSEKGPGDMRRHVVTQTTVKNYQLMLV